MEPLASETRYIAARPGRAGLTRSCQGSSTNARAHVGELHASLREVENGVFRAQYGGEINPENPHEREVPDCHVGTSATDVKIWVEQMALHLGYSRVIWE